MASQTGRSGRAQAAGIFGWWGEFTGAVRFRMAWDAPRAARIWFPWDPPPPTDVAPAVAFSTNDGPLAWHVVLGPACRCHRRARGGGGAADAADGGEHPTP